MEEGDWVLEVEEALLDEAPPEQLRLLLAGRPLPASLRADVWLHCLESEGRRARIDRYCTVYIVYTDRQRLPVTTHYRIEQV